MGKRQMQLLEVIQRMCRTHGEVRGVRPLSSAMGRPYANVYARVRSLETRGLIAVEWPGKGGTPVKIRMHSCARA